VERVTDFLSNALFKGVLRGPRRNKVNMRSANKERLDLISTWNLYKGSQIDNLPTQGIRQSFYEEEEKKERYNHWSSQLAL
jgi:hypothetical protein